MDLNSEKWNLKWEKKRKNLVGKSFGVLDILNQPYSPKAIGIYRDNEFKCLDSCEVYENPGSIESIGVPHFACKICSVPGFNNITAVTDENGKVLLLNVNNLKNVLCVKQAHNDAIFDANWMPEEAKLLTVSGDHSACLWDVGQSDMTPISTFKGHSKSLRCADFMPQDPAIFATGSRDGSVNIWDSRAYNKSKPDQTIAVAAGQIRQGKTPSCISSVTGLAFQDKNNLICCGTIDECIRIWDMRKTHHKSVVSVPKRTLGTMRPGCTDVKLSPDRIKLYASVMNGGILCFNLHSERSEPIAEFKGHDVHSFYVKISLSSDGAYLASGSSNENVYIWKTNKAELEAKKSRQPLLCLSGHASEVTSVDISLGQTVTAVSCSDDGTVRTWKTSVDLESRFRNLAIEPKESSASDISLETTAPLPLIDSQPLPANNSDETDDIVAKAMQPSTPEKKRHVPSCLRTPPRKTEPELFFGGKRKQTEPISPSGAKRQVLSPTKVNFEYRSPTMNLPNYVIDGSRPSHSCPRPRQKENKDWLTELRHRSAGKRSLSTEKTGPRHRAQPDKKSSRKTLLEYYKKSSKSTDDPTQKHTDSAETNAGNA